MNVTVNGEPFPFDDGATLAALVDQVGCGTKGVAVAVNEEVVPRSTWAQHVLRCDDRVEVLKVAQGG
jgi:sulfur carrier protein